MNLKLCELKFQWSGECPLCVKDSWKRPNKKKTAKFESCQKFTGLFPIIGKMNSSLLAKGCKQCLMLDMVAD